MLHGLMLLRAPRLALGLALAVACGCAGLPSPFASKAPTAPVSQTYVIPSVAPLGATQEAQRKGGVTISVSTVPFSPKQVEKKAYKKLPTFITRNGAQSYEETTTPFWCPSPSKLRFKIRVLNHQSDVIRLSGVLVRLNLDGKDYALDAQSSGLRSFIDGVLAPQEQKEFDLAAASADKLRDGANVSLRIYGVPTGSTKEKDKGNFEWNYRVTTKQETKDVQLRVETVALRPDEVQSREFLEKQYPPETRDENPIPQVEQGALYQMMLQQGMIQPQQ